MDHNIKNIQAPPSSIISISRSVSTRLWDSFVPRSRPEYHGPVLNVAACFCGACFTCGCGAIVASGASKNLKTRSQHTQDAEAAFELKAQSGTC